MNRPDVDADVVRRAQRGDLMAMHEVLDALTPYVRRLCGPIALQDAPDAAQVHRVLGPLLMRRFVRRFTSAK